MTMVATQFERADQRDPTDRNGLFHNVRRRMTAPKRPLCCLAVDAEEDFDWTRPVYATGYSTDCMSRVADLQEIVAAYDLRPTYLLTFPVLEDDNAVRMIRREHQRGGCDMGIQLHSMGDTAVRRADRSCLLSR